MPKCNKSEGQAIDYASELMSTEEALSFKAHLKNCGACRNAVDSWTRLLCVADTAVEGVTLPERALENLEMNVYKRLASRKKEGLFSRIRGYLANMGFLFRWQRTAAASTIAIALVTAAVLMGELRQPEGGLRLTEAQSADARMERYRQQDIQRLMEDAMITHHLRNDAWETESRLQRVKERAEGNGHWMKMARTLTDKGYK